MTICNISRCKIYKILILTVTLFVVHVSNFSHVLLLLVQVSLVMLLCYGLYVDVPLPLSQLVSLGEQDSNISRNAPTAMNRTSDSIMRIDSTR